MCTGAVTCASAGPNCGPIGDGLRRHPPVRHMHDARDLRGSEGQRVRHADVRDQDLSSRLSTAG